MSQDSTAISISRPDSTFPDKDTLYEKIDELTAWIHLLRAHRTLLKAKITNERKSNRLHSSNFGDCTVVNETFYSQVLGLWTAVQNHKITVQNETNRLFNVLAPEVMGDQLNNGEMETFRRQIKVLGSMDTPLRIVKLEGIEDKEKRDIKLMENQREMVKLIAEVGDKMEQAESYTHPREIERKNKKLMKIKICRSVINSLLVNSHIDFEENPHILDIKIRWRPPITLKATGLES